MASLYDYLSWRGDIPFSKSAVNEIDSLLFSILSYGHYDKFFSENDNNEAYKLTEIAQQYHSAENGNDNQSKLGFFAEVPELLKQVAASKRFANVRLSRYVNTLDSEKSMQFAAMVFSLGKKHHYIAFRGTDTNLIGWQEDLWMSFMDEIPAQRSAAKYAQEIFNEYEGKFHLGGHSKGGNLAVYAAVKSSFEQQKRITTIFNHDGPGFHSTFIESEDYQQLIKKIRIFIPKSSIVGILLEHGGDYTVVESKQISILQHDPFSWEIEGSHFVYGEGLSKGVLAIKTAVRSWLAEVPKEERESFVKGFCEIIGATGAKTLEDLTHDKLQSVSAILKAYSHMSKESKAKLKKTMDIFFKESRKSFKDTILEEIDHILPKKKAQKSLESD